MTKKFGKKFLGNILIFVIIIITVLTFISFIKKIQEQKQLNKVVFLKNV